MINIFSVTLVNYYCEQFCQFYEIHILYMHFLILCRRDCWLSYKLHEVVAVSFCGSLHCYKFISYGLFLRVLFD